MCSDWSVIAAVWLVVAAVTSVAMVVGARSFYFDGEQSIIARRLSIVLGVGAPLLFVIGLACGIRSAIHASAGPLALHGVDVFWVIVGRSRSMNISSVLVGIAGAVSHALMRRRSAGEHRTHIVVLAVVAAASGLLGAATVRGQSDLCEALVLVREIQIAQEAYRAEKGTYANVSTALAANQASNHNALYPSWPSEPQSQFRHWNVPCPVSVCNAGSDWAVLPVHVDGPVVFGYSTIAGRAGERPTANVTIGGKLVQWPVPETDWYIVTAVGDPASAGRFVTVVGSSFSTQLLIDLGGK
jgi:hypothetical protein